MLQFTNATIMLSPSFDLQLKKFGVDMAQLKEPATHIVFHVWAENWEKQMIHKDCCVTEARFIPKYTALSFYDPDDKVIHTVYHKNLTFVKKIRG